MIDYYFLK